MRNRFTDKEKAEIASDYKMGSTIKTICEKFNCTRGTIYQATKLYDIKVRNRYNKNSLRSKNNE